VLGGWRVRGGLFRSVDHIPISYTPILIDHGFATGRLNVLQTLLAKPDNGRANLPLTRQDLYRD